MNLRSSARDNPAQVRHWTYSPYLCSLGLFENFVEWWRRPNQFYSRLLQPLGKIISLVLLPVVSTVHNFDLMKLRRADLPLPLVGRCPPDFHFAGSTGFLISLKTRCQQCS